ncbi:MAG: hypothetical protein ACJASQ_001119 [Crocinitomicaceae bacterium]|jgi:hypothetical protein
MVSILKLKGAFLILFVLLNSNSSFAKGAKSKLEVIIIQDPSIDRSKKEAIIVLPGLGDGKKQRKAQKETFNVPGYDLFIPDYIDKESFDATYSKFIDFHKDQKLGEYKKLHVFSYILGSWTINTFVNKNGIQNIRSIVYDRSPMQERAPIIIVENIPRIAKMMFGALPKDLSLMPYPTIDTQNVNIGIIVEGKATGIMRHFKEETIAKGAYDWGNIDYNQNYDDLMYTHLNHNEMYLQLDYFASHMTNFFETGSFLMHAQRKWYGWESFEKLPKIKKSLVKYNPEFIGKWESETFYNTQLEDSAVHKISIQLETSKIEYNKTELNRAYQSNIVESGSVKVDKNGTVIQFSRVGNILPLNQEPKEEANGKISMIVNNIKYFKKN